MMNINEFLESKEVAPLDEATTEIIEEFFGGTYLAYLSKAVEHNDRQQKWEQKITLTKREQLAGFVINGLINSLNTYSNIEDMVANAYEVADEMLK